MMRSIAWLTVVTGLDVEAARLRLRFIRRLRLLCACRARESACKHQCKD